MKNAEEMLMALAYATFEEWKESGYTVRKGEKSYKKSLEGKPLFDITQVVYAKKQKAKIRR